jgi:hypothetical protein
VQELKRTRLKKWCTGFGVAIAIYTSNPSLKKTSLGFQFEGTQQVLALDDDLQKDSELSESEISSSEYDTEDADSTKSDVEKEGLFFDSESSDMPTNAELELAFGHLSDVFDSPSSQDSSESDSEGSLEPES